ncbi:gliding motility lipoprotein GldK [Flavobacteriaceae bacterium]|nr:gliding motility lipoprotein GldK [Flavobacteriaceae bacterium]MDA9584199.1 gliding motility lipoprotein GldK [Flavobacteriaceae bacterium]MDB2632662.1 gliding motility lipoprotein GldK [Flavobacteriaceae bacterium]MDC0330951.1 gliding motility lipoprotein GldK [Flavobacteriaceae bacterium]
MKKAILYIFSITIMYGCGSNDRGELVGVKIKNKWFSEKPFGMVSIPAGSFTMGKQDEDITGTMSAPPRTVSLSKFFMDETEISNSEYKQFVEWVKDSIVRTELALMADFASGGSLTDANGEPISGGIYDYAYAVSDTTGQSAYQKYMFENYYELDSLYTKPLNKNEDIIWDTSEYPDLYYAEVMDSLYTKKEDSRDGVRTFNTKKLKYNYTWYDVNSAVERPNERKSFLEKESVYVYPDTTVWIKDFNYSYNDPMHQDYFYHPAYQDYPVVGVSWNQAQAFCNWRTKNKNDRMRDKKNFAKIPSFRLPTEAEWEYAARGGLEFSKYPWGGPNTTSDRGCFLANFKPVRGNYAVDGALYTVEVQSFNANDYGLYNMSGNVSEWTNSSFNSSSYYMGSTMNSNVEDRKNKRKIIRGGSWKDVAYYLEVSTRDFEYADTARSYIGFRTVQSTVGPSINTNN